MFNIPKEELALRLAGFQALLRQQGLDGALLMQNVDVYYFSGTMQRAHLFIPAAGAPVLMIKRSYLRATAESAWEQVVHLENPKELLPTLKAYGYGSLQTLGLELDVLPAALFWRYEKMLAGIKLVDVSQVVRTQRMIKSPYEINLIKKCSQLNSEIYGLMKGLIREGVSELKLAGEIEALYRERGSSALLRLRGFNQELTYGHLLSGENTAVSSYFDGPTGGLGPDPAYPQGAGLRLIKRDEPLMIDYGFVYYGYVSDQTRVFCLGRLPDRLLAAYETARQILYRLAAMAKPGVTCESLYYAALEIAETSGFGGNFMGYPEKVAFVGHGIGLELDELPVAAAGVKTPLAEGMVLALEPKIILPGGAVGIENTYLITRDGSERITQFDEAIIYV